MESETSINPDTDSISLRRAKNSVFARLICCIVNEKIATGHIIPCNNVPTGVSQHTSPTTINWAVISQHQNENDDGCFYIQLSGMPLTSLDSDSVHEITLLDPSDLSFPIVSCSGANHSIEILGHLQTIVDQIAKWRPEAPSILITEVKQELQSCIEYQAEAYDTGRKDLRIDDTTAIEWEQSLVEGNPTHPMHKARLGLPPVEISPFSAELMNPTIHFFAVTRKMATVSGDYENLMKPFFDKVDIDPALEIIVPVLKLQVPVIVKYFPHARDLGYTEMARAQVSVRSVVLDSMSQFNFKFSLNVVMSSMVRTLKPEETTYGQIMNRAVEVIAKDSEGKLTVAHELGGICVNHEDPAISAQMGCIIRRDPESLVAPSGEKAIVCTALTERNVKGEFVVNEVFNLQTEQERTEFFSSYAKLYLRVFISPLVKYGLRFEAHGQNTLVRVKFNSDTKKWEVSGFVIRDFSGFRANRETLEAAVGFEIHPGAFGMPARFDKSLEDVHSFAMYAIIHQHLQNLVRALRLHYSGEGWRIIRKELEYLIPTDSTVRGIWLESPTSYKRPQLTLKLNGSPILLVPNLVLYEPQLSA